MSARRARLRNALYASVSVLALAVAWGQARAGEHHHKAKRAAKDPPPAGVLTVWMEGGPFWTGGGPYRFDIPPGFASLFSRAGLATVPGFSAINPDAGGEAAVGADYRFGDSPWHVSFDLRFGRAYAGTQNFSTSAGSETIGESENHLVADIMGGRDIALPGQSELKFGLRIADLSADLGANAAVSSGSGSASCSSSGGFSCAGAAISPDERSAFIGIGPRAAIESDLPLGGHWTFDYGGGVAVLFGQSRLDISGTATSSSGATASLNNQYASVMGVFNSDASAAVAYWFNPRTELSAGFRFDGYWGALKTVNASGNLTNVDRLYYGPFLRLTGRF